MRQACARKSWLVHASIGRCRLRYPTVLTSLHHILLESGCANCSITTELLCNNTALSVLVLLVKSGINLAVQSNQQV
jgi:hypothetical protein